MQLSNVNEPRRRATSLPYGLVRGEPSQSEVDHRGAVSRREEQGRLDIFFANVSARRSVLSRHVMIFLYSGWSRLLAHTGRDNWRDVHQCYANKCSVVSA